jgi:hypothetical protein
MGECGEHSDTLVEHLICPEGTLTVIFAHALNALKHLDSRFQLDWTRVPNLHIIHCNEAQIPTGALLYNAHPPTFYELIMI